MYIIFQYHVECSDKVKTKKELTQYKKKMLLSSKSVNFSTYCICIFNLDFLFVKSFPW